MVFINEESKEINCKVVYYGPPMCGKSTSLRYIVEQIGKKGNGEMLTLSNDGDNTLYFDFIPIDLGKFKKHQLRLHLYTVPGEAAYKQARQIISKGIDGVVFLADSSLEKLEENLSAMMELKELVETEGGDFEKLPMVIQYNKRDLPNVVPLEELRRLLNPRKAPDFETVATEGRGILEALEAVSESVLRQLREEG